MWPARLGRNNDLAWLSRRCCLGRLALVSLMLMLGWPQALFAQSIVVIEPHQCVWRSGDDLHWADPSLDETGWTSMTAWDLRFSQPRNWVRCHLTPAQLNQVQDPHLAFQAQTAYELFFQGTSIGSFGNLSTGDSSVDDLRSYALPGPSAQGGIVALRLISRFSQPSLGHFLIGSPEALAGDRARFILSRVAPVLPYVIGYSIAGIIGFLQLGLFYYDRSRRDLLWLAIGCISVAVLRINSVAFYALMDYPYRLWNAIYVEGNLSFACQVLFFFALARRRIPWWIWVLIALSLSGEFVLALELPSPVNVAFWLDIARGKITIVFLSAWTLVTLSPFVAFWPWASLARRLRPLVLCCFLWGISDFVYMLIQLTSLPVLGWTTRFRLSFLPIFFEARAFTTLCVLLVLLWLLFRDQRRIVEERALLAGEMQAARDIQRILVPASHPTAPGILIDAVFRPAQDVGGDFYRCRVLPNGAMRVLLGDVSGKGAAAAMTGAMLLGASEGHDADSPSALLGHLNRTLCNSGLGGFATCLCLDVDSNGHARFANAGHIAPYRAGKACASEPGLPLGIEPATTYPESSIHLAAGDTLTLLSDGVVEARNASGELFGFDRTAALSTKTANQIAKAAEQFGQEDDITVLTLTFEATDLAHA